MQGGLSCLQRTQLLTQRQGLRSGVFLHGSNPGLEIRHSLLLGCQFQLGGFRRLLCIGRALLYSGKLFCLRG